MRQRVGNKHIIKSYHWNNGILTVLTHIVEEGFDEAIRVALDIACHSYKIYNELGELVRSGNGGNYNSHNPDSPY